MKKLNELTEKEGEEILKFIFPEEYKKKEIYFNKFSFEPIIDKEGRREITFGGMYVVGILYYSGINMDRCLLRFEDTRVILWLYSNNYDITELLEKNQYLSDVLEDYIDVQNKLRLLTGRPLMISYDDREVDFIAETYGHPKTKEEIQDKLKELVKKYYFKEYE